MQCLHDTTSLLQRCTFTATMRVRAQLAELQTAVQCPGMDTVAVCPPSSRLPDLRKRCPRGKVQARKLSAVLPCHSLNCASTARAASSAAFLCCLTAAARHVQGSTLITSAPGQRCAAASDRIQFAAQHDVWLSARRQSERRRDGGLDDSSRDMGSGCQRRALRCGGELKEPSSGEQDSASNLQCEDSMSVHAEIDYQTLSNAHEPEAYSYSLCARLSYAQANKT